MASLGRGQRPLVMPHYPHMLREDVVIWTRFLQQNPGLVQEVWYDVHVGKAMTLPMGAGKIERRVAEGVSRKRIDVVAKTVDAYWIVEVKPYGNMVALGQAVSYTRLFIGEFEADLDILPAIVCGKVDEDLTDEFESQGILVFEVGFD